jgi:hypothetical protein
MHCGSSRRPPRRTAFAGRLALLCALVLLALGPSAGPATAYSCGAAKPIRTLAVHAPEKKGCEQESAPPARRGNADPMSFMFFIGIILAVVLVPVALGRREELPPE